MRTKPEAGSMTGSARVAFSVRWFRVLTVRGTFESASAEFSPPHNGSGDAAIAVRVHSASVHTGIALRDRHLRGHRFLDAPRYPVIAFESDTVTRRDTAWVVRGRLAFKGWEHHVTITVPDEGRDTNDRWLTATFSVPRRPAAVGTARGIRRLNPLLWAIGDEVSIRVEVLVPARRVTPVPESVRGR
jgi:polyisoprenoid-binding protein YceI